VQEKHETKVKINEQEKKYVEFYLKRHEFQGIRITEHPENRNLSLRN
jgi:hypothetical protein